MSDLSGVFKIANLAVGALSVVSGVTQLLNGLQDFLLGLYLVFFGAGIGYLEFNVPPLTHQYASFLFSFLGRGIFYLLIGAIIAHDSIIRGLVGLLVAIVGVAYASLEFVPSIEPPENFRTEGHILADDEEDIV